MFDRNCFEKSILVLYAHQTSRLYPVMCSIGHHDCSPGIHIASGVIPKQTRTMQTNGERTLWRADEANEVCIEPLPFHPVPFRGKKGSDVGKQMGFEENIVTKLADRITGMTAIASCFDEVPVLEDP